MFRSMFLYCICFCFTSGTVVPKVSWKSSVPWGSLGPRVSDGASITGQPLGSSRAGSAHPTRGQGPPQVSRQLGDLVWETGGDGRETLWASWSSGSDIWYEWTGLRGSDLHHRSWSHTALWCAVHLSVYPETQTLTKLRLSLLKVTKLIMMYWRGKRSHICVRHRTTNTHRYAVLSSNPRQALFSLEAHWSRFPRDASGPQFSLWPRHALRAQLATLSWLKTIAKLK